MCAARGVRVAGGAAGSSDREAAAVLPSKPCKTLGITDILAKRHRALAPYKQESRHVLQPHFLFLFPNYLTKMIYI